MDVITSDLSRFGWREKRQAARLLMAAAEQGLPEEFYDDEVTVYFNTHSGCVFLTNSEYQAAMLNGDRLELWHSCPYCGHEGFAEEMDHEPEDSECSRYLRAIGVIEETDEDQDQDQDQEEEEVTA